MKLNKKQLMLGLLFVALASRMYAADDKALIAQAREFAQKLAQFGNFEGRDLVQRLVGRVEHLMPLSVQVGQQTQQINEQAQRITSLEAQAVQAQQQRAALLNVLGVQAPAAMPVASSASISASPVTLMAPRPTSSSSLSSSSSSSSSSQPTLIDDASEVTSGLSTEKAATPIVSVERMRELFRTRRYADVLAMGKAIVDNSVQNPIDKAISLAFIGDIYRLGGNGVERNYTMALKHYEDAIKRPELPAVNRALSLARIGEIYCSGGYGVVRNYATALKHYEDAIKMQELPAFDRALSLEWIGAIYRAGSNGVGRNYTMALKFYEDAIKMPELSGVNRALSLVHTGDIYRAGGNGVERSRAMALKYYKDALAVQNGLNPATKAMVEARIDKIHNELQAQQNLQSVSSSSSSLSSSSSSSQPTRPNKRTQRTQSAPTGASSASSAKRARPQTSSSVNADQASGLEFLVQAALSDDSESDTASEND